MCDTSDRFTDVADHGGVDGYEPAFVDVDGVRTRYYDVGDPTGEPVVLVHGGNWSGSASANAWTPTFEHLGEAFRVLAFDRIGCGMTDNPAAVEDYRYRTELEHALAFLDAVDVDACHVAGSSRGGGLAATMAVEAVDRFETLVIVNSGTLGPPVGDKSHRRNRIFDRFTPDFEPTDPRSTRLLFEQYSHGTEHVTEEFCRTAAYMRGREKARETAEVMEDRGHQAVWNETMAERMRETRRRIADGALSIPTLYALGRNDLTVPIEMGIGAFDVLAQGNSDVRLKLFNECGHFVYREYPREFSRTVANFVETWR